ncbi:MAG: hypothetical protein SGI92_00390 [Bryobacteraceae bacterium]|nr:hypothetical protein [Bryobacteraceae bacterium]
MQNQAIFDSARLIELQLRSAEGVKAVKVRFPSDEEWTGRQRSRKVIIKQLGRGVSETTIPHGERADEELLRKIRASEGGAEFDAFEAARLLEELAFVEVDDVTPAAEGYRVALRVPGGTVAVVLRVPSAKDVFEYRRFFARVLDLPFEKQEMTVNLNAAGNLFTKLVQNTEGYEGSKVPVIHQAVAIRAAIDALDAGFAEDSAANF